MSTENMSTHPSTSFKVHPMHEADLIKHAVRKIPGGPALAAKWEAQKKGFKKRLPDHRADENDDPKHFWS